MGNYPPSLLEYTMKSALFEEAQALQGQTVALRRDIHRHPELGLHLPRTRATVLEALSVLDLLKRPLRENRCTRIMHA